MDLTETFPAGGGAGEDLGKTDFFDFVVSPPPHCASTGGVSDEDSYLHRTNCRGMSYLQDPRHDDHDTHTSSSSFIKETNNNTLTALPPVSTITGSLSHHGVRNHCVSTEQVPMNQSDCDYWGTDDSKEQTCNILLEDLNKYCWSAHANPTGHTDLHTSDNSHRISTTNDRQNTDGAIYTLTVLNNEANSMDALDCCKSPTAPSNDSWSLRPNLDLDAILSLEPSPSDQDHDVQTSVDQSRNDSYHVIATPSSQYADDSGFVESKELCRQNNPSGDNNNDWKLSDQNQLQDAVAAAAAAGDSAESLLRSALQGKLYTGPTQIASPSSSQSSTISLSVSSTATGGLQLMDHQQTSQSQQNSQEQSQSNEAMHGCTDDDLLLSQLANAPYRPGEYEKLKSIENEVVESYCSLEPVCNVSAAPTVLYTLDPTSGSLGTITLPADLGTVTVVAAQQDLIPQATSPQEAQAPSNQIQIAPARSSTKAPKKYCRRSNKINANSNNASGNASGNSTSGQQPGNSGGSPSSVQRKERSLHYCSICSKGFKDKYSVNVHIRTHTGEKPFACSLCGKSFRQKAHLAKHYQTHVAQKPSSSNNNANGNSSSNSNSSPSEARANHNSSETGACNQSS